MCGVVGLLGQQPVNQSIYDALTILQHRGQDAAGMLTCDQSRIHIRKDNGLVRDAIRTPHMQHLRGNMGIGHVRYPTAGSEAPDESQPFYVNSPYGLGLVHNGNLTNTAELRAELGKTDLRHLNTESDSEVLLNIVAHELGVTAKPMFSVIDVFQAMTAVFKRLSGAYATIMLVQGHGLLGFRDPFGIRPLVLGKRIDPKTSKPEYMLASESIALDALGFELLGDVQPGEAVFIDIDGGVHRKMCSAVSQLSPCIFESIYLARHDSILDGISIYQARLNMGAKLGEKIKQEAIFSDADVVIPIPDTSRVYAVALAKAMSMHYSEGFIKNRYIGRTFIMPGQQTRRSSVRLKLNAIKQEFYGKNVLLVDDSIVRGTTSKEIIQMAREAGAKKVYFASAAPEVRHPNVYGIDMPTHEELVAHNRDVEQIAKYIGADGLLFLDLDSVVASINQAVLEGHPTIDRFEDSIFTGEYLSKDISEKYLVNLALLRNDAEKSKRRD